MTTTRPNPFPTAALTAEQASAYLTRIALPTSLVTSAPSFSLLSQLLLSHHEQVPKDTTTLHVPEAQWTTSAASTPIALGSNFYGMPLGVLAYKRVVEEHKGAFCFALNPTFSSLLRFFGFRISELVTNCYQRLGNDPKTHEDGLVWGAKTHEVLVADWVEEGGEKSKRYLIDVGFGGGGCPIPIELRDGTTIMGLNNYDAFKIVNEPMPFDEDVPTPPDVLLGWTLYRRIAPAGTPIILPITASSPGFWSPQFHFLLQTVTLRDFGMYHHYSASHELAAFTAFFLVTKLIPGTKGARRSLMFSEGGNGKRDKNGKLREGNFEGGSRKAKVHTTGGEDAKGSTAARDIIYVDMEIGAMREHLETEWGFKF